MVQNTIYLDGVSVESNQLLGKPGEGMVVAQDTMMFTRLVIAAMSVGAMKRCAQLMLRYAQRRTVTTGRLLENPVTITRLSELTAAVVVVETYVKRIAEFLDTGIKVPEEAYIVCKTGGPEFLGDATDALIQLLGGRGYIETNIAPQLWRDARILRIFEGPTETLTMYLGSRACNKSEIIHQFMTKSLGASAIANELREAVAQIKTDFLDHQQTECGLPFASPFSDTVFTDRWIYTVVGELVTLGMLWAALEGAVRHLDTEKMDQEEMDHGLRWIRTQFTQKREQIHSHSAIETIRSKSELECWIDGYAKKIGDLEQRLPAEEHELDPLLRQTQVMAPQTQSQLALEVEEEISDLHVPRPCSKQDETQMVTLDVTLGSSQKRPSFATPIYTVDAIQTWLIQWLATHLQTVVDKIDVTTALADYGLDSVMALELLDALETWLQEPLEMTPTLFWNYPTISELAAYLANRTLQADELTIREKMQSQPQLDVSAGLISEKMNLSSLSDSEMAQLLAQEIAASRTRRAE